MRRVFPRCLATVLSIGILCSPSTAEAVTVTSTADVTIFFDNGRHLKLFSDVHIANSDPQYVSYPISHEHDYSTNNCLYATQFTDFSFCCVSYGNYGSVTTTVSDVGCEYDAFCETFGYAAQGSSYAKSGCLSRTCAGDGDGKSPLVISVEDGDFRFSSLVGGVRFDLNADGISEEVSWTMAESDDAFLVLDRNANDAIDSGRELFGDATPQAESGDPNGFLALAVFDDDTFGGNEDGQITRDDRVFSFLRLWFDRNHDGVAQDQELEPLEDHSIIAIDLDHSLVHRRDRHGNEFRFRGRASKAEGGFLPVWDVFLLRGD